MDHFEGPAWLWSALVALASATNGRGPAVHGLARSAALATAALMVREVDVLRLQPLGVALELRGEFRPQQSLRPMALNISSAVT